MTERDRRHQLLEAGATAILPGLAEIGVDDGTRSTDQPRATARSTSAYRLSWLSRWCWTCLGLDWRI